MLKSTRLPDRDYRTNGWYFVTICTRDRFCFFGDIVNGKIKLSKIGEIADKFWFEIPQHSKHTYIDTYVIMPDHIHGIIIIDNPNLSSPCRDVACNVSTTKSGNVSTKYDHRTEKNEQYDFYQEMSKMSPKAGSLSSIVRSYKAAVTHWCKQNGYDNFAWQPRFYEHIIRADDSLNTTREYIVNNPLQWQNNQNNSANLWM
ncbi:conserved hypothetical protein [Gloeothece citriformis PCC 7424]|uniref:Transposase IS200-like domain-containing protein n=1 Tax=Gloeothece citriformis (strain PCC 7424) TaxID=65393 RepID=B7K8C0_GLOC7|nr:transposase [Gloeothece citriformis]ACK69880.1 conserved hypothetical protein [Gloeothece citriformis PCC 7424]